MAAVTATAGPVGALPKRAPINIGLLPRRIGFAAGATSLTFLFCMGVLGAPLASMFLGLTYGSVAGLLAIGLILVYRTQRFVNFAAIALGATGGRICYQVMARHDLPFAVGLPAGLAVAALVGLAVEFIVIKRFLNSPRLTLTVATIALAGFLPGTSDRFARQVFPFLFPNAEASTAELTNTFTPDLPLKGFAFHVGDFPLTFGFKHVLAIEIAIVGALMTFAYFRFTKAGVAVRGVADNSDRAKLLGISVGALSTSVWVLASLLSAMAVIAQGALSNPSDATKGGVELLLLPLAAAVIGRMFSIPTAMFAAVSLSCIDQSLQQEYRDKASLFYVVLLLAISISFLVQRKKEGRSEKGGAEAFASVSEQRPIPKELSVLPSIRSARVTLAAILLAAAGILPFVAPTRLVSNLATTFILAIVGLSLVVMTGWAGQVSLGQFGFVAIGAVLSGGLMADHGWPFWIAAPLAMFVVAVVAFLIGIPALRIQGLFLGVTTLALAGAVQFVLFNKSLFGWILPEKGIPRPSLPAISFASERSMYFLCLTFLLLCLALVSNLRKSRTGRILIGSRENEANLQSFGINLVRTKLVGFALSGALCGLAGALLAAQQGGVQDTQFLTQRSVDVFIYSLLGGIGSPAGVLMGAGWGNILQEYITSPFVRPILGPGGLLLLLLVEPGGLIAIVNRLRDAGLRIVAQRRQIIVPSLFADVDPEALRNRLIPLSEPIANQGIAALPAGTTYQRPSELYANGRKKVFDIPQPIGALPAGEKKSNDPLGGAVAAMTGGAR